MIRLKFSFDCNLASPLFWGAVVGTSEPQGFVFDSHGCKFCGFSPGSLVSSHKADWLAGGTLGSLAQSQMGLCLNFRGIFTSSSADDSWGKCNALKTQGQKRSSYCRVWINRAEFQRSSSIIQWGERKSALHYKICVLFGINLCLCQKWIILQYISFFDSIHHMCQWRQYRCFWSGQMEWGNDHEITFLCCLV